MFWMNEATTNFWKMCAKHWLLFRELQQPLGNLHELDRNATPVVRIEDTAATVGVDAHHLGSGRFDQPLQFVNFEHRDAELGVQPGRLHVFVVTASMTGVDTNEQLLASE